MAIGVAQTKTGTGSGSSVSVTLTATGSGNCLVVAFLNSGTSAPTVSGMTIGGSSSNFGALVTKSSASSGMQVSIWACPSCPSGQTALVVNGSNFGAGGAAAGVVAYEVSGLAATLAGLLDQSSSGNGSGTSWSSGATPSTTAASEFVVGAFAGLAGTPTGPSSPWANTSPQTAQVAGQQVSSSTGAFTYSGSNTTSGAWAAAVVTLFPAGLAGTGNRAILNQAVMRSAVF